MKLTGLSSLLHTPHYYNMNTQIEDAQAPTYTTSCTSFGFVATVRAGYTGQACRQPNLRERMAGNYLENCRVLETMTTFI